MDKAILLNRDFSQAGQLKPDKVDSPLQIEDAGGENTLRFNYPVQEHERLAHTWRIYNDWNEVSDVFLLGEAELAIDDGFYTAWPNNCLFFDPSTEKFVQVYNSGTGHMTGAQQVYVRTLDYKNTDDWSDAVLIIGDEPGLELPLTHLALLCNNGDYIAFPRRMDEDKTVYGHDICRSADKGATWGKQDWASIIDFSAITDPGVLDRAKAGIVKSDGTIIVIGRAGANKDFVAVSTNHGVSWTAHEAPEFEGGVFSAEESTLLELPNGKILLLGRKPPLVEHDNKRGVLYSVSNDGIVWSTPDDTNMPDGTASPHAMIYHSESGIVEVFAGSRYSGYLDGKSSLWRHTATPEMAEQGLFYPGVRIVTSEKRGAGADFGYPAAANAPDGFVLLTWYDGDRDDTGTAIYQLTGRRVKKGEA